MISDSVGLAGKISRDFSQFCEPSLPSGESFACEMQDFFKNSSRPRDKAKIYVVRSTIAMPSERMTLAINRPIRKSRLVETFERRERRIVAVGMFEYIRRICLDTLLSPSHLPRNCDRERDRDPALARASRRTINRGWGGGGRAMTAKLKLIPVALRRIDELPVSAELQDKLAAIHDALRASGRLQGGVETADRR